jgi:hypothetical protein
MDSADMARRRWRGTTKPQRTAVARAAAVARWRKHREKQEKKKRGKSKAASKSPTRKPRITITPAESTATQENAVP